MKRANTKEEMKNFAKDISRNADLVEELGLMCDMQVHTLCGFSEGLQQADNKAKSKEKFLKDLRKLVKDEIMEILASRKVSTIVLVKYYFIFTESELYPLFSKHTVLESNIKKLIIISQIEKLLVNTVQTDDEDQSVAKAVNRIYKGLS